MAEMHSPLASVVALGRHGAATDGPARLTLAESAPPRLVQVAGWQDFEAAVEPLVAHLGLNWPADFRTVTTSADGARHLFRLAPDRVLIASEAPSDLPAELVPSDRLAVLEVTHGRWTIEASGPALEDLLHRLVPIDFRESRFPAGTFVQTAMNKVSVLVWRTAPDSARIVCPTSSTRWLWGYVTDVAAPLGYEVAAPG